MALDETKWNSSADADLMPAPVVSTVTADGGNLRFRVKASAGGFLTIPSTPDGNDCRWENTAERQQVYPPANNGSVDPFYSVGFDDSLTLHPFPGETDQKTAALRPANRRRRLFSQDRHKPGQNQ